MTKPKFTFEGTMKHILTIGAIVGGTFYVEDRLEKSTTTAVHAEITSLLGRVSVLEKAMEESGIKVNVLSVFMNQQVYRNKINEGRTNDVERFLNKKYPDEYLKPSEITFEDNK